MPLPGLRGTDHIGFTVPNLDEADDFLVNVLGCERVYTLGPFIREDDWMQTQLGVHPRTVMRRLNFYRLGFGSNLEVFEYDAADGALPQPRNSDIGGHHLAIYVDDFEDALAYLRSHNVEIMGEPVDSSGPSEGQRWVYFKTPWGMQFELVSYPHGKQYEELSQSSLLWNPCDPAQ
jgi:catechol 2,3-dioxygenase-like lactoylglutathione lyase family enzyme